MPAVNYNSNLHIDDPKRSEYHAELIKSKPFLKSIYKDWYNIFKSFINTVPNGKLIEIGSGGGFIKEVIPQVITSDIMPLKNCDLQFSAEEMPFMDDEVASIFMINVLHHISKPDIFLKEASRTLKKGGKLIMIEPANSNLSRYIYKKFHHEPFDTKAGWDLKRDTPLSESNQAVPWIIFERDYQKFKNLFPELKLTSINYHTPLSYILSGGLSRKTLVPDFSYPLIKFSESILSPFSRQLAMFQTIVITKTVD